MASSTIKRIQKKRGRGRPATGQSPVVMIRMPEAVIAALDAWATEAGLSRSSAARKLIEAGLMKFKSKATKGVKP